MDPAAYIRRETRISMVINGVLSLAFFLAVFGGAPRIALWGIGQWVFDCVPQSLMIALMSTLVPGALTARRLRAGAVRPSATGSRLPRSLLLRALVLAIAAATLGPALVALGALASGGTALSWAPALLLKVGYGVTTAPRMTPPGLRAALAP